LQQAGIKWINGQLPFQESVTGRKHRGSCVLIQQENFRKNSRSPVKNSKKFQTGGFFILALPSEDVIHFASSYSFGLHDESPHFGGRAAVEEHFSTNKDDNMVQYTSQSFFT
jgi:hypothetical protein